ncbi:winged helix-turn-helix transcriptional regulator [Protaetiibacter larvae]|uniref:Helix-turn-helix transcriptional regulator n=1 Tax=Protaetiibacter larvae TaxID=2592654 RepID=A0A5C1Y8D1_9MICO|nr:helix-turn-helix domain-containing protein [Protaetiibacter larvae]QEO10006.1 helix-turn-helix transcriptional regulator [Protaetiibacter larvae]
MAAREYGQYGGITRALELVGERWSLLIIRDLLVGPRRYGELAAGLPRIPSNILAARLKELQEAGVIRRAPRSRIIVYELTPYGRELEPAVLALGAWGFKALGDPRGEQLITPDSMTMDLRTAFRAQVAAALPPTAYAAHLGPTELLIRVEGPSLEVSRGAGPADLAFSAGHDIRRLISGELSPTLAIASGVVDVLHGPGELLDRFASTFRIAA